MIICTYIFALVSLMVCFISSSASSVSWLFWIKERFCSSSSAKISRSCCGSWKYSSKSSCNIQHITKLTKITAQQRYPAATVGRGNTAPNPPVIYSTLPNLQKYQLSKDIQQLLWVVEIQLQILLQYTAHYQTYNNISSAKISSSCCGS